MKLRKTGIAAAILLGLGWSVPAVPAQAAAPVCSHVAITVEVVPGSPGAGSFTEAITVRNTGGAACDLSGHPGVQRARSSVSGVSTLGAAASWTSERPVRVILYPGQQATAPLRVTRPENYGSAACGTVARSDVLNVYLPNTTQVLRVHTLGTACTSPELVTATVGIFR